MTPHTTESVTP